VQIGQILETGWTVVLVALTLTVKWCECHLAGVVSICTSKLRRVWMQFGCVSLECIYCQVQSLASCWTLMLVKTSVSYWTNIWRLTAFPQIGGSSKLHTVGKPVSWNQHRTVISWSLI
jgi:hypothetical protein